MRLVPVRQEGRDVGVRDIGQRQEPRPGCGLDADVALGRLGHGCG